VPARVHDLRREGRVCIALGKGLGVLMLAIFCSRDKSRCAVVGAAT